MFRARIRDRVAGDDGSLILSMLAMLVISALLLVVAGTVLNGQVQTRFDGKFEKALQVAEVGHDQMISLLQSNVTANADDLKAFLGMPAPYDPAQLPTIQSSTADGGEFVTTVELLPVAGVSDSILLSEGRIWKVTSTGWDRDGTRRTVESEVRVSPLFSLAAFGKTELRFRGGNGAGSYDSRLSKDLCVTGSSTLRVDVGTPTNALANTNEVEPCDKTGISAVATNGLLRLEGNARDAVKRAEVHNAMAPHVGDPLNDAAGECEAMTCSLKDESPARLHFYREPIVLPEITACSDGTAGSEGAFNGTGVLGQRKYYFSDVTLTGSTTITGVPGTDSNPNSMTVLCVSGRLTIADSDLVNFEAYTYNGDTLYRPRAPGGLMIYVTGESNPEVTIGGGSSVSAAIYAPNASINGSSQANVYGSLVGNSIINTGGWNFFYDQDLSAQMMNAPVSVRDWRERF